MMQLADIANKATHVNFLHTIQFIVFHDLFHCILFLIIPATLFHLYQSESLKLTRRR